MLIFTHIHTSKRTHTQPRTHSYRHRFTHIRIYIYIYIEREREWATQDPFVSEVFCILFNANIFQIVRGQLSTHQLWVNRWTDWDFNLSRATDLGEEKILNSNELYQQRKIKLASHLAQGCGIG